MPKKKCLMRIRGAIDELLMGLLATFVLTGLFVWWKMPGAFDLADALIWRYVTPKITWPNAILVAAAVVGIKLIIKAATTKAKQFKEEEK